MIDCVEYKYKKSSIVLKLSGSWTRSHFRGSVAVAFGRIFQQYQI